MTTQVKVGGHVYTAAINGMIQDRLWGNRASKSITLALSYATVSSRFTDNAAWSILDTENDVTTEYDNSEYSLLGDITVHRDGTVTVKMGKPTEAEKAASEINSVIPYLSDAGLTEIAERFPLWAIGEEYAAGAIVREGENVFRCLQAHTATDGWNPLAASSLWGICHTKNPKKAVAWVAPAGTSGMYYKDECYKDDSDIVWRQTYDGGNVYDAAAMPSYWEQAE